MAFLADDLDPLADDLHLGLGPGAAGLDGHAPHPHHDLGLGPRLGPATGPASPSYAGFGMDLGMGMGMSLADELDGPGPEDLGGGMGMGSLALELEQPAPTQTETPTQTPRRVARASPAKANCTSLSTGNGNGASEHGHGSPLGAGPPGGTRGGRRRRSPSSLTGTPTRRRGGSSADQPPRPSLPPLPKQAAGAGAAGARAANGCAAGSGPHGDPFGGDEGGDEDGDECGDEDGDELADELGVEDGKDAADTEGTGDDRRIMRAEAAAAAAMQVLRDSLASSAALVQRLQALDRPVSARSGPSRPSAIATARAGLSSPGLPSPSPAAAGSAPALLEDRLHAHLARLGEAERLREEQARDAAQLTREVAAVRSEDLPRFFDGLGELLGPEGPAAGPEGPAAGASSSDTLPGWTGEAAAPPPRRKMNGFAALAALETIGEGEPEPEPEPEPDVDGGASPLSPAFPRSPTSPLSPVSHTAKAAGALPAAAAAALVDDTAALGSLLTSLSESVSLALARLAADGRSLRRVRAGLKDWHDREGAEAAAARATAAWEARVARGDVPDARGEVGALMAGFEEALERASGAVARLVPVRETEVGVAL